jgi:type IV pilus assembly protein PilW
MRQGFWGDLSMPLNNANAPSTSVPAIAVTRDCIGTGLNNATIPKPTGHFRSLWGTTAINASPIGCITNAKSSSDVLQLKRVRAQPSVAPEGDRYYLTTNGSHGEIFPGNIAAIPVISNSQLWEYQHHVYYVREEVQHNETIPVLMQGTLRNIGAGKVINFQPLIEGIEMIRFMYGVDTDNDGVVNAYISAGNMTEDYWNYTNAEILAVKVYVLARDILPDNNYVNGNTYQLGDFTTQVMNDNYRRLVFSSTVTLYNSGVKTWASR